MFWVSSDVYWKDRFGITKNSQMTIAFLWQQTFNDRTEEEKIKPTGESNKIQGDSGELD